MQLFLDTNIYLNYFKTNQRDHLKPLKRLDELVKSKEITLVVPTQVIHEYKRNRRRTVEETRNALLQEKKINLASYRVIGVDKKHIKAVERAQKELANAYDALLEKFDAKADGEATEADKLIKRLFRNAVVIPDSDEIIERAHRRYMRGNPPRKANHSYGDAIVWELLLEHAKDGDLTIVSADSDFTEKQKGKKALNSFMREEWSEKSKKGIHFFDSLAEFINHFDKKNTIEKEIVEDEKKRAQPASPLTYQQLLDHVQYGGLPIQESANLVAPLGVGLSEPFMVTSVNQWNAISDNEDAMLLSGVNQSTLKYCPHCGCKTPLGANEYLSVSRNCRECHRHIPYGI